LRGLLALLLTACGGGVVQSVDAPPPPPPGLATLQIIAEPADVEVTIDDAFAGVLTGYREGLIAVRPGPHRVRLGRAGCLSGYFEVDVPPTGGRLRTHLVCTSTN
jgi:hypothetical protein